MIMTQEALQALRWEMRDKARRESKTLGGDRGLGDGDGDEMRMEMGMGKLSTTYVLRYQVTS